MPGGRTVSRSRLCNARCGSFGGVCRSVSISPESTLPRPRSCPRWSKALCEGKEPEDAGFTRADGEPVRDFRAAWQNLCVRAGAPGPDKLLSRFVCSKCEKTVEERCKCGGSRRYIGCWCTTWAARLLVPYSTRACRHEHYRQQDCEHAAPLRHLRSRGVAPCYAAPRRIPKPLNDPSRQFATVSERWKDDGDNTANSCTKCALAWCAEGTCTSNRPS